MADEFWNVEWEPGARELYGRMKEEAAAIGDEYLGTVHLLLAATGVTSVEEHGFAILTPDAVRAKVLAVTRRRPPDSITITPGGQTPRLKSALIFAMKRARAESRPVRRRDIWYGLLADDYSEAVQVLYCLGVQIEELRESLA